ncbi:MAG: restriction endonuclease subunit S [bacterium]
MPTTTETTKQGWQKLKLGEVCDLKTGKLNSNAAVIGGQYPFFTCAQQIYEIDSYAFDQECVLLGGNNANGIYPLFYFNGKFNAYQRTYILSAKKNNTLNYRFLYYMLRQKLEELRTSSTGAATKFLTLNIINPLEILLPPFQAQNKIAEVLGAYDDLIEVNQKKIKILEELAQSIYKEWFVKPTQNGIPDGWEITTLGKIADIKWGDTSTTKQSYILDGYDAFSASGLDGKLDHFDYEKDGIVLSAIGANCGLTWLAKGKWSCIKNTIRIIEKVPEVSIEYLYLVTSKPNYWRRRGAAQPFISQTEANTYPVLKPETSILKDFTSLVRPIYNEISHLIKQNQNLQKTRDILIPQLVGGNLLLK